jgi:hypothetical protein
LTSEARSFVGEVREQSIVSIAEPGGDVVWFAVGPTGTPLHPLQYGLEHSLELRFDDEIKRSQRLLRETFEAIGWHEVVVPTPDGIPDLRIASVARTGTRGPQDPRQLDPSDLAKDMEALATLVVVPDEVEQIVQMTRLLYVRGWHQWEFFTLAKREAVLALESSLRRLAAEEGGHASRSLFVQLLTDVGRSHQPAILSEWERREGHRLRKVRNMLIHPMGRQAIDWISWARSDIERCVLLINLMWLRLRGEVPIPLAWELDD